MTPAGEAGTLSSLRALLDVAAVVRSRADLQHLFEEIASTVAQALGFLAVVVNVYRPAWDDYEVVVVEGDDAAARISSPVSGAMMIPISRMPASAIASMP